MLRPGIRRDRPAAAALAGVPTGNFGMIQLADGSTVRGAKKGGITDHIAGPHLIPNVGREAMVPAECVRRNRPVRRPVAKPQPKAKQPAEHEVMPPSKRRGNPQAEKRRTRSYSPRKARSEHGSPPRIQHRSRSRDSNSSAPSEPEDREEEEVSVPRKEVSEEEKRRVRLLDEEARERERKRQEEERRMLAELEEARKKRQELEAARRKNLGGAFALTEDDIDAEEDKDNQKARAARELARAEERRAARERLTHKDAAPGASNPAASSRDYPERSSSSALVQAAPMRMVNKDSVTAADIDGSLHEHKFAKVWKDWDASKKDDPGEIARQFMRVSAVKRRGYCPPKRSMWSRSRSRSRSRRRQ
mmetsp:Transcript_76444/g.151245  ORF Transcript_76444/g.151245 Transcript_76444/m.151245 type:complete len:362 (-) Transcript_76444:18-1103(-)